MKKYSVILLTTIAIAGFFTVCLFSCKKNPKYSCDPGINQYAATMSVVNQNITRDELAKHSLDTQMAIFRSLTPENKKRIYNEKIDLILNTDTTLTLADREHLIKGKNYFSSTLYGHSGQPDSFSTAWQSYALDSLHWTRDRLEAYTYTYMTMAEFQVRSLGGSGNDCTCRSTTFGCCIGRYCDKNTDCETTNEGCGIFGTSKCTGKCPWD